MVEAWRKNADSVLRFAQEECEPDEAMAMNAHRLFETYCGWAAAQRVPQMTSTKFYKRFAKTGIVKDHTNTGNIYRCRIPREARFREVGP